MDKAARDIVMTPSSIALEQQQQQQQQPTVEQKQQASSLLEQIDGIRKLATVADSGDDPEHRVRLQQSVQRLLLAVESPAESIMRIMNQPQQNAALRVAVELGLPQALVGDGSEKKSITGTKLAEISGGEELLVVRLMRVLAALGLCDEDGPESYRANERTRTLALTGIKDGVRTYYDLFFAVQAKYVNYFNGNGFRSPDTHENGPFHYSFQAPFFEHIAKDPKLQASFNAWMLDRPAGKKRWLDFYPVSSTLQPGLRTGPDEVLLVDVGGNHGFELVSFKELHGHLPGKLVLQDLPGTLAAIKTRPEGIEIMDYDFFQPQPVKGARAYFFRVVCHDWSDNECRRLLSNTVAAMEPGYSRLLLNEFVLPNTGASLHSTSMDMLMMALGRGIERTEKQWRALLGSVGLEILHIYTATSSAESVIETWLPPSKEQQQQQQQQQEQPAKGSNGVATNGSADGGKS